MDLVGALASGMLAGLGVAMPLGAISVLLLGEGVERGFWGAAPGALAVGTIDTLYSFAAVVLGAVAAPVIVGWGPWPMALGGLVLVGIAAAGLWRSVTRPDADGAATPAPTGRGRHRFALFLGLTAVNPTTLVYFAAITVGLADLLRSPVAGAVFVAGVGVASACWQLALVAIGSALGRRATPRAKVVTARVGNAIVAALGIAMILRAVL
jgi:arginine exporter protein ArgO